MALAPVVRTFLEALVPIVRDGSLSHSGPDTAVNGQGILLVTLNNPAVAQGHQALERALKEGPAQAALGKFWQAVETVKVLFGPGSQAAAEAAAGAANARQGALEVLRSTAIVALAELVPVDGEIGDFATVALAHGAFPEAEALGKLRSELGLPAGTGLGPVLAAAAEKAFPPVVVIKVGKSGTVSTGCSAEEWGRLLEKYRGRVGVKEIARVFVGVPVVDRPILMDHLMRLARMKLAGHSPESAFEGHISFPGEVSALQQYPPERRIQIVSGKDKGHYRYAEDVLEADAVVASYDDD